MSYDLSDDEFCETNFFVPSPIKKRKSLLPSPQEWKGKLEKSAELENKIQEVESMFLNFVGCQLTKKVDKTELLKYAECDTNNIIKAVNPSNNIRLFPKGRTFFISNSGTSDSLEPPLWFSDSSAYSTLNLEDFLKLVRGGFLFTRRRDDEENETLRRYCFEILRVEQNTLLASLLLQYLASHPLPFSDVSLKTWKSPFLPRLFEILEKSASGYNARECQILFRECCRAALDSATSSCTHIFPSILAAFLHKSSTQFSIAEEIDWIIALQLQPEECSHFLKILPQSGDFKGFGLMFAFRIIHTFIQAPTRTEIINLEGVAGLLKANESTMRNFSMNQSFHFLNILNYIMLRLSINLENHAALEEIISIIGGFKLYYHQEKSVAVHVLNECINRITLTLRDRVR